jgi:hypothetical protein
MIADCQSGDSFSDCTLSHCGIPDCGIEPIDCRIGAIINRPMNRSIGNWQSALVGVRSHSQSTP